MAKVKKYEVIDKVTGKVVGTEWSTDKYSAKGMAESRIPLRDLVVIFKKRSTYDIPSYAGWGTDTVGINVFRDDAGNCFIWKSTSAFFNIAKGSKVRLRGTVKDHSDYKGTKHTILQRCKVDAVKL